MCVLSQRFTAGDLSLSLSLPPKVSPLQERGFSIFVTCVGGLEALEALLSTEVYQGLLRGPCSSVAPCPSVNSPLRHLGM